MQTAVPARTFSAKRLLPFLQYGVYVIFVLLVIFFSFQNQRFLTINNALLLLQQAAPIGISVIGMTFVLIVAGIDISVAQNMYLSAVLVAVAMYAMKSAGFLGSFWSYVIIYAIALLVGAVIGSLNGLLIAKYKIVPFLATLAVQGIARGLALIVSKSKVYFVPELSPISNGRWLGFPVVAIVLIVLIIIFDYVLRRTTYGRHLMAIGNDKSAAEKIGINVDRNIFLAYLICGVLAGLAGVLAAGQGGAIAVYFHYGDEFLVISSAVLGGISLFGGKGAVFPGALIGIILVGTIVNGMTMMNASPYAYTIVRGAIIFLAVMVDSINFKGELR
ncbi:MAG TPA: ABC transporter permease [Anaerolineaceae bacterium]|jgi:ribose/xylose/arabinose/galactoside ABC-type transport system permease subunit